MFLSRFVVMLRKVLGVYSVKKKKQSYVMFITGKKKLHWALKNKVPLPRNQCVSSLSFCVCLSDSKWIQRYN